MLFLWVKSILIYVVVFGMGVFVGYMFYLFGGNYNGMYGNNVLNGFFFLGIFVDIFVILVIIWVIKNIFIRRRY